MIMGQGDEGGVSGCGVEHLALPIADGSQDAQPRRRPLCVAGDGGSGSPASRDQLGFETVAFHKPRRDTTDVRLGKSQGVGFVCAQHYCPARCISRRHSEIRDPRDGVCELVHTSRQIGANNTRAARRGIWRGRFVPPWDWRRGVRLADAEPPGACAIKGNVNRDGERIYCGSPATLR